MIRAKLQQTFFCFFRPDVALNSHLPPCCTFHPRSRRFVTVNLCLVIRGSDKKKAPRLQPEKQINPKPRRSLSHMGRNGQHALSHYVANGGIRHNTTTRKCKYQVRSCFQNPISIKVAGCDVAARRGSRPDLAFDKAKKKKKSQQITPITARGNANEGGNQHAVVSVSQVVYHRAREQDTQTLTQAHMNAHAHTICCCFFPSPRWSEFKYNFIASLQKPLCSIICLDAVRVVPVGLAKLPGN